MEQQKKCKILFFWYIFLAKKAQKWWKMAKFCVPLFRWPWMMTLLWFFLLDLDILYKQILIPCVIRFRKHGNGLHRAIKYVFLLVIFIYCCRSAFLSKSKIWRKYCANQFFSVIKWLFEDIYSETFMSLKFICNMRALGSEFMDL